MSSIYTGWSIGTGMGPPAVTGSFDKNFTQAFNVTALISVHHNLQKYPAVTIVNSANDVVVGDITYIDLNNLTVEFSAPFSGTVICN